MSTWMGIGGCGRPASSEIYLLVNLLSELYVIPLFFDVLLSYLVGMKRRTSRCFTSQERQCLLSLLFKNLSIMPLGVFLVHEQLTDL